MFENLNDEQLMLEVKRGKLDALGPLFEKYHVKLYNFFLRMTGHKEISEDLTQNVFSRILNYRESYNEIWPFRSWMYQIARNAHHKYYKENKLLFSDYFDTENAEENTETSFQEIEELDKTNTLYEALSKLDTEQREIIELARFQGLKYSEISKITGNSIPAIKVKVHRAIKKLKTYYFELA